MSALQDIQRKVIVMAAEAQRRERDDMKPALIVYSITGFCELRADPEILHYGDLSTPFESRPLFGCVQEIDPEAKRAWRVLSAAAAIERTAAAQHRRIHGRRSNSL